MNRAVVLAWMRDVLSLWKEAGWGWCLWNLRGAFGVEAPRVDALLGNLLRNAFAYTDAGSVRVEIHPDSVVIEDTGVGLPAGRYRLWAEIRQPGELEISLHAGRADAPFTTCRLVRSGR